MNKKDRNRQHLLAMHGFKYIRHYMDEGYVCFYCNAPADTLDHVPPLTMIDYMPYEERRKYGIPAVLLPCCSECNVNLGDKALADTISRLEFLEWHYDKFLQTQRGMWTEEEINKLGYVLQLQVKAKQKKLDDYVEKVRNIQTRLLRTDTHPTFEPNYKEEDGI